MKRLLSLSALAFGLALLAVYCNQPPPDTRAADEAAIRDINKTWFTAYNAGDAAGIVALHAEDAVVCPPGAPAARGASAIRGHYEKELAAGFSSTAGPTSDVGASGDLGWESGTYTATDKSGKTVDVGKYVTVFAKKNGKWLIIRDIWNSDGPMKEPAGD
jgi:uncharacterized protein (TIGR02246 family)